MSVCSAYIAVHGGAGLHSHANDVEIKRSLKSACSEALTSIDTDLAAVGVEKVHSVSYTRLDMVSSAIASLEDNPYLNAGYGSNLTLDGTVECDAAIMDGHSGDFGSVGAISGIKNPIRLARSILEYSKAPDPIGRIPPLTLVSEGAYAFAIAHGATENLQLVHPDALVSPRAREEWKKWKDHLNRSSDNETPPSGLTNIQDTVGAVAFQHADGIAAGVSSGGILLKYSGRIGEAAMFGAGCWAQQFTTVKMGIACSISGAGEYIARAMLARAIGDAFHRCISKSQYVDPHDIIHHVFLDNFWGPCRDRGVLSPDVGIIILITEEPEGKTTARLWCAFTTPSMAIAYASSENSKPKAQILRRPKGIKSRANGEPQIFITAISL